MRPDLPALGLGTSSLALCPESEFFATIDLAYESGIRYFDTAPLYGGGQAEVRLGQALTEAPANVVVSTKCGRYRRFGAPPPFSSGENDSWDFSEAATRHCIDLSSARLDRDYLDIVFLHDIEASIGQALCEALPVLRELRSAGRIGMIGAGCNTVEGLLAALATGFVEVVLVAGRWTLLDRTAQVELLPKAGDSGTKVVAGGILNSGCLADPGSRGARFDYRQISEFERSQLLKLAATAAKHDVSLTAAALQFPARDARVGTTLLGASSPGQLQESLAALSQSVPEAFWDEAQDMGLNQSPPDARTQVGAMSHIG